MKKIMFFAAIACMALASCTKQELEPSANEANAIGFSTYAGRTTAGTKAVTDITALQTNGFELAAFYTGQSTFAAAITAGEAKPNYMYQQDVTYASDWAYTPVKYWPNAANDKISFFGYTDEGVSATSGNNVAGYPTVTFAQDANNSIDFVVAATFDQSKTAAADQKVTLAFKHALTRIRFAAKIDHDIQTEGPATKVFITDITVNGTTPEFYTSGIFTFSDAANCGSWTTKNNPSSLSISLNKTTPIATDWGGYVTPSVALPQNGTALNLLPDDYMFVIPSASTGLTAAMNLTVTYEIVTVDGNLFAGHTLARNTATITLAAGDLSQGKAYGYELEVGLKTIKVTTTIDDWGTEL